MLHNFVAYVKIKLNKETYDKYIALDLFEECRHIDGHVSGKHVWDLNYPELTFCITGNGFRGCTVSTVRGGDVVCVPLGEICPLILRADGNEFLIRGYI